MLRKSISMIIALLIIVLYSGINVHANSSDLTLQSNILDKLSILKGDGVDYNLQDKLKRSEAAAFIVRMIGKESFVQTHINQYRITKFNDVDPNQWYASYVGYCVEQGIIKGKNNTSYAPNDNVSEKEFLTLVLGALDYRIGKDFTWDNVYSKAFEASIVSDPQYSNNISNNNDFIRADVVKLIYTALKTPLNNSDSTLIEKLVHDEVIDKELAVSTGLYINKSNLQIINAVSTSPTRTLIEFNEVTSKIEPDNIQVFENNQGLQIKVVLQQNNQLVIETPKQNSNQKYTVKIKEVKDKSGGLAKELSIEFQGYQVKEVKSDFFKVSKVIPVSKNFVNVYFTQPITLNAELPFNYEILKDGKTFAKGDFQSIKVKLLEEVDNGVTIYLKDKTFSDGEIYNLKINGNTTSVYGAQLNEGSGETVSFVGSQLEDEKFMVSSIISVNNKTVLVEFNKSLDRNSAQSLQNYSIVGTDGVPNPPISVDVIDEGALKGKAVYITVAGVLDESKRYELTLKNISDAVQQTTLNEKSLSLYGNKLMIQDLFIVNVSAFDNSTLLVYFNKALDQISAVTETNYLMPGYDVQKVYFNINEPYYVKLFLSDSLDKDSRYKLTVFNMKDNQNNLTGSPIEYEFTGSGVQVEKPLIYEAKIIAKNIIKVRFSKEVATSGVNTMTSNYSLQREVKTGTSVSPDSVSVIDETTFVLRFSSLDFTDAYNLKFNMLEDYSGLHTRTSVDGLTGIRVTLGQ